MTDPEKFIEAIDANDNGISAWPSHVQPAFEPTMSITGLVASLNPAWNFPASDSEVDRRFEDASKLMGEAFLNKLDFYGNSWLPARDIVQVGLNTRHTLDPQGQILHLPQFCPWTVVISFAVIKC
jgi:MYG1 exonuclease